MNTQQAGVWGALALALVLALAALRASRDKALRPGIRVVGLSAVVVLSAIAYVGAIVAVAVLNV